MKKRVLSLVLTLCMLLGLLPAAALAATETDGGAVAHTHGVNFKDKMDTDAQVAFQRLTSKDGAPCINGAEQEIKEGEYGYSYYVLPAGSYYLADDVTLNLNLEIQDGTVNLCLNNRTLDLGSKSIVVNGDRTLNHGTLNLCDCGTDGLITSDIPKSSPGSGTITVNDMSKPLFTMYGGTVKNTSESGKYQTAVAIGYNSGTVDLRGGKVISEHGSAFYLGFRSGSTLTLSGNVTITGHVADIDWDEWGKGTIALAGPLTNGQPYRVRMVERNLGEDSQTLTSGWTTKMGSDADFSQYFTSVSKGIFIDKITSGRGTGELALVKYKITTQPAKDNNYTVTVNYETGASYQWYTVTDGNATGELVSGQITNALTTTAPGTYKCKITWTDGTELTSNEVTVGAATPEEHTHSYGEWSKNEANHWQECTAADCPAPDKGKKDEGSHSYTNAADTTCDICGYERTVTPPASETFTVTFNANGGSSVASQTVTSGEKATQPGDPTREGYNFVGWFTDEALTSAYDFTTAVTGNITLYAKWIETYNVSGSVKDSSNKAVSGATVTLKRGTEQIGEPQTTDRSGQYAFTGVVPGSYNIVATQGQKTVTTLVTIVNQNITENLTLPSDNVNSVLQIDPTAAAGAAAEVNKIVVGNLDKEAKDVKLTAGATATSVTVTMTVTSKADDGSAEVANIKNEAAKGETGGTKKIDFLEIKVEKKVETTGSTGTNIEEKTLTETANVLTIVIPFDFTGKNDVKVYRYHSDGTAGGAGTLPKDNANGDGEYYVCGTDSITIHAKKFSTYAIGYTETAGESPTPPAPSGSGSSGGGSSSYTPTTKQPEHGKVSLSPARPEKGDKVTVTVTPENGYTADTVTVTDRNGKPIEVTKNPDGTFSFIQPAGKVTVAATLRAVHTGGYADCPKDETCPIWPYTDASAAAWYHDGVHYCIDNGLMTGYGGGLFGPDQNLSRAMLAQILYSQAGKPAVSGGSSFEDMASGAWYAKAVAWAAAQGIVSGYGDGRFGPDDNITREQLAAMLWRNAESPASTQSLDRFTDGGKTSAWAAAALSWAVEQGILSGKGGGILDPTGQATRAEAAAMLMRYLERTQAK